MGYYVIHPDGSKFGPAELEVLQKWVDEKRIGEDTLLEDAVTGKSGAASFVPGLKFGVKVPPVVAPPPPPPVQPVVPPNPYEVGFSGGARPIVSSGPVRVDSHMGYVLLSMIFCPPLAIVAVIYATRANRFARNGDLATAQLCADRAFALAQWAFLIGMTVGCISGVVKIYRHLA